MGKLAGKIALVTGATSGIGEATAIRMAEEGASLALLGRCSPKGEALVERISAMGGEAVFLCCDVSSL